MQLDSWLHKGWSSFSTPWYQKEADCFTGNSEEYKEAISKYVAGRSLDALAKEYEDRIRRTEQLESPPADVEIRGCT